MSSSLRPLHNEWLPRSSVDICELAKSKSLQPGMEQEVPVASSPHSKTRSAPSVDSNFSRSHERCKVPQALDPPNSGLNPAPLGLPNGLSRQASPATSTISTLSTSVSATPPPALQQPDSGQPRAPPAKRRKLTPQERETKEQEKLERDRLRMEEKIKREEVKQAKDSDRRQKNEEKEERRRVKEIEKQQKEDEKRKREEEKEKKARAQSRINSFFVKPSTPAKSGASLTNTLTSEDHSSLMASTVEPDGGAENAEDLAQRVHPDYGRTFLPFSPPSHSVCAPINHFSWDAESIAQIQRNLDRSWQSQVDAAQEPTNTLKNLLDQGDAWNREPPQAALSMKQVMIRLTEPAKDSTDLETSQRLADLVKQVRVKYIYFHQDVRPPYIGTYSKVTLPRECHRARRNPFSLVRNDTNYDYDSEAEWEEVEEGEDLVSEGDSETGSADGSEEMGEFLDDEGTSEGVRQKSRLVVADLEPVCSGICWEDEGSVKLHEFKLQVIQPYHKLPIDPFSDRYWPHHNGTSEADAAAKKERTEIARMPLQQKPNTALNGSSNVVQPAKSFPLKTGTSSNQVPRVLTGENLELFKRAVQGSDLTKLGLLAVLKKAFPKTPNAVLKDTLGAVAARVGKSEAEKIWVIVDAAS